jgi:retron-type reverse transcriptase
VLTPVVEPECSAHSYGYRPGRSAHEAVQAAQEHIRAGHTWTVEVDISAFFD